MAGGGVYPSMPRFLRLALILLAAALAFLALLLFSSTPWGPRVPQMDLEAQRELTAEESNKDLGKARAVEAEGAAAAAAGGAGGVPGGPRDALQCSRCGRKPGMGGKEACKAEGEGGKSSRRGVGAAGMRALGQRAEEVLGFRLLPGPWEGLPGEESVTDVVNIKVDVTKPVRRIPEHLFGIFFEEINHAGAGGIHAELVNNRGFEAGGLNHPTGFEPWYAIGNESYVWVQTEAGSPFPLNPTALRLDFISLSPSLLREAADQALSAAAGAGARAGAGVGAGASKGEDVQRRAAEEKAEDGAREEKGGKRVGVYNAGFWGMNIVAGEKYNVTLWARATHDIPLLISFACPMDPLRHAPPSSPLFSLVRGLPAPSPHKELFSSHYDAGSATLRLSGAAPWGSHTLIITASASCPEGVLALTTTHASLPLHPASRAVSSASHLASTVATLWLDQVSAMPLNTFKGHGFRPDLVQMLQDLHPGFVRFPGGCFVEGHRLRNAFKWRQSVGPWQDRPGHFNDVWNYWTDDALGLYEFLQLSEDIGAKPVWVFNSGTAHYETVPFGNLGPYIEDVLDGIEFARGSKESHWGSLRATMGHPDPFPLRHIAVGNEDCYLPNYQDGFRRFQKAIKEQYPDIQIIYNCDLSRGPDNHPATDLYDFHYYGTPSDVFALGHFFDSVPRDQGPKAFVSEYAVTAGAGQGNLQAAVAEAGLLVGLEKNSDVVDMVSYAPQFVNANDRAWNPDAIVFNTWQSYGTPSYWVQHMFQASNGATLLDSRIVTARSSAAALRREEEERRRQSEEHSVGGLSQPRWGPINSDTIWGYLGNLARTPEAPFFTHSATRHTSPSGFDVVLLKAVNFWESGRVLQIVVQGGKAAQVDCITVTALTSPRHSPFDENSFTQPTKVVPRSISLPLSSTSLNLTIPPMTVLFVEWEIGPAFQGKA